MSLTTQNKSLLGKGRRGQEKGADSCAQHPSQEQGMPSNSVTQGS